MTQPAKVQEPSMEEILASIRRIIADDEAKPPAAEKPASPAAAPAKPEKPAARAASEGARDERHSSVGDSRGASRCREGAPPAAARAAAPAAACARRVQQPGRYRRAAERPRRGDHRRRRSGHPCLTARCSSSPTRWRCRIRRSPRSTRSNRQDDLEFTESAAARALHRQPAFEPPPLESPRRTAADPVALDRVGGRIRLQ